MQLSPGVIYAFIAAFGLGAVTSQAKLVYADGGDAMTMMFWRFAISIILIGLLLLIRRQTFVVNKEHRTSVFLIGFIWSGAMICYLKSVETISVSLAVLILYSYPILVLLISMFSGKIKISGMVIFIFFMAFIGIAMMLGGGDIRASWIGITFAALAASGAAYTFISGSKIAPKLNPITLTFWVNATGFIMVIPLMQNQLNMPDSTPGLIYLGGATMCYIIAILCQFQSLSFIPAAKAAFIFNLEPFVSIMLAVTVLGEHLTTIQWTGAGIVLAVLFLFSGKIENKADTTQ